MRRAQRVRRTLSSVLAATLLFVSTGAAVAASGGAVPGDRLYLVKRGAERVHLLVSFAPESDARLHLKFARARLAEAQRVVATQPQQVPDLLDEVVAAVERAEEAGGPAVVEEVEVVRAEVGAALPALAASADAAAAAAISRLAAELGDPAMATGDGADPSGGASAPDRAAAPPPLDQAVAGSAGPKTVPDIERLEAMLRDGDGS